MIDENFLYKVEGKIFSAIMIKVLKAEITSLNEFLLLHECTSISLKTK